MVMSELLVRRVYSWCSGVISCGESSREAKVPEAEPCLSARSSVSLLLARSTLAELSPAVMGDAGRLYVAPDVIPVYRTMLPLATIITPNWFEVEYVHKEEPIPSSQQQLNHFEGP